MSGDIIFKGCKTGVDFENKTVEFLGKLGFNANKTSRNDGGIDIVATKTINDVEYKFYIQCKYYNTTLGKHPIQEVFAGSHYYEENSGKGVPVVISNNAVTREARLYAKRLGVEIIADAEWTEIKQVFKAKKVTNPNQHHGLMGLIIAAVLKDIKSEQADEYLTASLAEPAYNEEPADNEELILKVMDDFDEAEEDIKESARLYQKATQLQQKGLNKHRDAIIRHLKHGRRANVGDVNNQLGGDLTMAVLDKMFSNLDSLTIEELEKLQSRLDVEKASRANAGDVKGLLIEESKVIACPHCGSASVVKCGKKDGKQRYKCKEKECGKTFMRTTNTMFTHSRLSREQWLELLRGMVEGLSINKIADNIGTSGKCIWYNEKKVMSVLMEIFGEQDSFVDITECDEYSVHLSFKGKRDPAFFIYKLGRFPRHNYTYAEKVEYLKKAGFWDDLQKDPEALEQLLHGDCYLAGTNRDSVCILTGKDRSGNLFAKPVCVGTMERYHLNKHMDTRFAEDAILVTDCNNTYDWFAEYRSIHHEQVLASKHAKGPYNLARINAIHSNLTAFWSDDKENLPATKYLEYDIMLFWWLEKNKDLTTKQLVEELYALISNRISDPITYQELKNRKMDLDTKGIIPVQV